MKSIAVSVMWPVWEWLSVPSRRWLFSSYGANLSTRDALKSRRLIQSPWFQQNYGHLFSLTGDQNAKTRYENDKTGYRIATSVGGGATGEGGDRIVADDPHNVNEVESDPVREGVLTWWDETMSTRGNDPKTVARIIVMQRAHEADLSGHVLAQGGYEHLCLPAEYERVRPIYVHGVQLEASPKEHPTSLGYTDPRQEEGELLWKERFNDTSIAKLKRALGTHGVAGQLQQRPSPRGGRIFMRNHWRFWQVLPELDESVISVDCTFKDLSTTDYVAIQVWGRKGANKYLLYRLKQRMGLAATVLAIRAVSATYPKRAAILIEDKANGPAVIETLKGELSGIIAINPEGGKVARAFAMQPEQQAGNIWLPDPSVDSNIEEFLQEVSSFPGVPHDDETDAMTQAVNWYRTRERSMGLFNYMAAQAAAVKEKQT